MILPTIAPTAVPPSLDEPDAVGPGEVELEVTEDTVDSVKEVADGGSEVPDGGGDVIVDGVGVKVEGDGAGVEEGVGVTSVELGGVGDTGGMSVVLGGVGPP